MAFTLHWSQNTPILEQAPGLGQTRSELGPCGRRRNVPAHTLSTCLMVDHIRLTARANVASNLTANLDRDCTTVVSRSIFTSFEGRVGRLFTSNRKIIAVFQ